MDELKSKLNEHTLKNQNLEKKTIKVRQENSNMKSHLNKSNNQMLQMRNYNTASKCNEI